MEGGCGTLGFPRAVRTNSTNGLAILDDGLAWRLCPRLVSNENKELGNERQFCAAGVLLARYILYSADPGLSSTATAYAVTRTLDFTQTTAHGQRVLGQIGHGQPGPTSNVMTSAARGDDPTRISAYSNRGCRPATATRAACFLRARLPS